MGVPPVAAAARRGVLGIGVLAALWPSPAGAELRPTEGGGPWSFDAADVIETWDEPGGQVRVHYSVSGPNATQLEDADDDLVPDFAQRVALVTAESLDFYADELGLRPPVPETELGEPLGGNAALDVYLVDFGGAADGRFGIDGCLAGLNHCAGFLVVENDFVGYGYPSLEAAVRTVASHEAFHAVQAAYYAELPVWVSEGTATWATRRFDAELLDFVRTCAGYLADPGRPIYEPPLGPVPAFAYGSALWWEYLSTRDGDVVVDDLLAAIDDDDGASAPELIMDEVLAAAGDPLGEAWPVFARYNLAVGFRAGVAESHAYAAELEPIEAAREGASLDLEARLYPLAAAYWRVDHAGGTLGFGADAPLPDVVFSLHPVGDFAEDGVVGDPVASWDAPEAGWRPIMEDELPAGGYWIVATLPVLAEGPAKARVCVGTTSHLEQACALEPVPAPGADTGLDDTSDGDPSGAAADGESGTGTDTEDSAGAADGDESGCACGPTASGRHGLPLGGLLLLVVARGRRRRP